MGNRFREKTVEEGLDGDVARETLKEAVARNSGKVEPIKTTGNRRRRHEEVETPETRSMETGTTETGKPKGNRRRRHEEEHTEWKSEEEKQILENEEQNEEETKTEETPYNADEVEDSDKVVAANGRGGRVAKGVAKVLGGDILADKLVMRQIPLLLLCLVFLLLLVANRYQVESLSHKKMAIQERVNELREQQIQLQKKNQNSIRISQIRDDLKREKDLGILPTPPNVI